MAPTSTPTSFSRLARCRSTFERLGSTSRRLRIQVAHGRLRPGFPLRARRAARSRDAASFTVPDPQPSPFAHLTMAENTLMEKLVSLAKRRGFVFQSSEVYGGLGSVWDYGPLGVELKKNVKDRWWRAMVHARDDIEGLDAAILMHPRVWEASGHVAGFTDPLVDCRTARRGSGRDKIKGMPAEAEQASGRALDVRPDRAAHVQPDVQDLHGAGGGAGRRWSTCGRRRRRGSTSTTRTSSTPRASGYRSALPRSARRSGTRSRRETSSSGPVSSSRWKCSSS